MNTKKFTSFVNESDEDEEDDNPTWDYEKILDVIESNSPENAAQIILELINNMCRYR